MYVLQCRGGYPIPITTGGEGVLAKVEICGVQATVSDAGSGSRLTLVDDYGKTKDDDSTDVTLADFKGVANSDGVIGGMFAEPIKTRKGLAVSNLTNLVQGSILVYTR